MSSRSSSRAMRAARLGVLVTAAASVFAACDREQRRFRESPPAATPSGVVRVGTLQPGAPRDTTSHVSNPYENNAYAISEGQRLFGWYNCSGCHSNGGGGMGPPLMDDKWIYGSSPENIYTTIIEGRPNGMPSFAGKIPSQQVWELVSYVRSLSGLTPSVAGSSRNDHMMVYPGSQVVRRSETPKHSYRAPGGEMP